MGRQYGLRTSMSEVGPKLGGSTPFATVISKFWLASLPDASLAVHCTGVLPTGKRLREGGVQVTWGGPHPSVATASKLTWAESPQAASAVLSTRVGTKAGGVVSPATVTWKVIGVAALPVESLAVQVTSVVPTGNKLPDGGMQVGVTVSQLSEASTAKVT